MGSTIEVCLISYPYYPSQGTGRGHDRYAFELSRNIARANGHIHVHSLDQGYSSGVAAAGTKQLRLLADLLRARADLYHAISPVGGAMAAMLGKRPLVVTVHDLVPFHVTKYDASWKHWYVRLCTRIATRKSDAVVVPYEVTKHELVQRFSVPEAKISVVRYGVDHSRCRPQAGVERKANRVLYIGEVSRSKGVDSLVRAFALVAERLPDAELLIGGKTSKDQPMLERLAHDLDIRNVAFLGYVPEGELSSYYCSAAAMVFPSRYGFGLSTLEAMACGTPVVVGAVLDAPEFLADAGLLVDPDDVGQMADAIQRILTENGLRQHLSEKAIERAKSFSWEGTARETASVPFLHHVDVDRRRSQVSGI
ncbi:MAG: hypothetical protein DRI39_08715 [Chloroflexi bacterium]|nr:MAG: hypothetical protein DRI39_08715 [Chloroflexota bacterium]